MKIIDGEKSGYVKKTSTKANFWGVSQKDKTQIGM